jgi:hypothetical protein
MLFIMKRGDIEQLREAHPAWAIGTVWATAGSGPDRRKLWAKRDGITVHGWSAAILSEQIAIEERLKGWNAPEPRPSAG